MKKHTHNKTLACYMINNLILFDQLNSGDLISFYAILVCKLMERE